MLRYETRDIAIDIGKLIVTTDIMSSKGMDTQLVTGGF